MAQTLDIVPNYRPNPKQVLLHNAPVSYDDIWIILYGGVRGGGKSAGKSWNNRDAQLVRNNKIWIEVLSWNIQENQNRRLY